MNATQPSVSNVAPLAETICQKCSHRYRFEIASADPHCPSCGYSALPQPTRPPLTFSEPSRARRTLQDYFIPALGVIFFVVIPMALFMFGKSPGIFATIGLASPIVFFSVWLLARAVLPAEKRPQGIHLIFAIGIFVLSLTALEKALHL